MSNKTVTFGGLSIGSRFLATYAEKDYSLIKASRVDAYLDKVIGKNAKGEEIIVRTRKPFLHHEAVMVAGE